MEFTITKRLQPTSGNPYVPNRLRIQNGEVKKFTFHFTYSFKNKLLFKRVPSPTRTARHGVIYPSTQTLYFKSKLCLGGWYWRKPHALASLLRLTNTAVSKFSKPWNFLLYILALHTNISFSSTLRCILRLALVWKNGILPISSCLCVTEVRTEKSIIRNNILCRMKNFHSSVIVT